MRFCLYYIAFADRLHAYTRALCMALLVIVFFVQLVIVVLRYAFSTGRLELQDLVAYAFGALVVLSIPLALRTDKHVRVDIFRERMREETRRRVDALAIVFLLVPVFGLTFFHATPGVLYSWQILEGSIETGGLPGYFAVKTMLPVCCLLMITQGLAIAVDVFLKRGSTAK